MMKSLQTRFYKDGLHPYLIALLAASIQIQITLFSSETYAGIRINMADIILPILMVCIATSLLLKKSLWPTLISTKIYYILAAFLICLTLSLWISYNHYGYISNWAFINKYAGFYILLSYAFIGAWLSANNTKKDILYIFAKSFVIFFICILAGNLFLFIVATIFPSLPFLQDHIKYSMQEALTGLMANRNAFMLTAVAAAIFIECYRNTSKPLLPEWGHYLFWATLPYFLVFNASRVGWAIFFLIFLTSLVVRFKTTLFKIMPALLIGSILCYGFITLTQFKRAIHYKYQFTRTIAMVNPNNDVTYAGDQKRLEDLTDGWDIYKKSNPLWGAGLGSYSIEQTKNNSDTVKIYILESTGLWLLVETGILGFGTFSLFFIACLYYFYQHGITKRQSFHQAVFFILLALAACSFLHEVSYTRFIWFMLGLGLVLEKNNRSFT